MLGAWHALLIVLLHVRLLACKCSVRAVSSARRRSGISSQEALMRLGIILRVVPHSMVLLQVC